MLIQVIAKNLTEISNNFPIKPVTVDIQLNPFSLFIYEEIKAP